MLYQLDTGKRTMVSTHPSRQEGADISGDLVVWYDWRNNPKTIFEVDLDKWDGKCIKL